MSTPTRPPFTRLPTTDPAVSDIYDKLQAVTQALPTAAAPAPASTPAPTSTPAFSTQTGSYFIPNGEVTTVAVISAAAVFTLPDATSQAGETHQIINSWTSGATLRLGSYVQGQKVNGADPGTFTMAAGKTITVVSDGKNWNILSRIT